MSALTIYGDPISGNCLKVKWTADYLRIPTVWKTVNVVDGEANTPDFLSLNPNGKVPILVFPDGRILSESNAIINYLAEGSSLIPREAFPRARMLQWMFWEQYSHEPYIAVRRYRLTYLRQSPDRLDPKLLERGHSALTLMQSTLEQTTFMAGEDLTLADVALVAYTRMAHEGGFDLEPYPDVRTWIGRVESQLNIGS